MRFEINGKEVSIPSSLEQIPLGKFIEWYDLHGSELDKELQELLSDTKTDPVLKEIEVDQHMDKEGILWMQFWSGYDFESLRDEIIIVPALDAYRIIRFQLKSEEEQTQFPAAMDYAGETWELQNYKVDPESDMTTGEIVTAKEVIRQLAKMGASQFQSWLYLCCIFLRKKDEKFHDSMVFEGSARMELMKKLPMNHALRVGFFLKNCVGTWASTSEYLPQQEPQPTPSLN